MKNYNVQNYVRYKNDLRDSYPVDKPWDEYTRDELIIKFMPFAEQIAKSFSTTDQASGVMDITDLIQEANYGLVRAIDRIEWDKINVQDDIEKQIKGFISKRIKGSIRRAIDINRGDIRIPEHKLNEIRKNNGKDREMIQMFFNSIFVSFDKDDYETNKALEIEDTSSVYNINILNKYILSLMRKHLNDNEYEVLRLSFGLDCDRIPAKKIAEMLGIKGVADFVRVSQIKREAIDKLIDNVDPEQVLDLM